MDLILDFNISKFYKSISQQIRVVSEDWTCRNIYCSYCGKPLRQFENNRPVADFYCINDHEEFELKSKAKSIAQKVMAGQYDKMIARIMSDENPNLFLLSYHNKLVNNFCVIPKYFLTPSIIEKRNPLAETARRPRWTGCNILISRIPEIGKVFYVKNGQISDKQKVLEQFNKIAFLKQEKIESRGWILDIMQCVDKITIEEFTLQDVYFFEDELSKLHPENHNIKPKIRQQLQILRDRGFIEFIDKGKYLRIK